MLHEEGSIEPGSNGEYILPCCKFKLPHLPAECGCSQGLGDTVAKLADAVGIKKRKGCKCDERQEKLNRAFPYRY